MRRRKLLLTAAGLALGVAGTFYFRAHPAAKGCADPYYAGGACRQAVSYSYSFWYYASLALIGIILFLLAYKFLTRKNT